MGSLEPAVWHSLFVILGQPFLREASADEAEGAAGYLLLLAFPAL